MRLNSQFHTDGTLFCSGPVNFIPAVNVRPNTSEKLMNPPASSSEIPTGARPRRGRRPAGVTSGREALIKAANLCFMRQGYRASLRDIATEAGVDMALAARLFGSKEKLWEAVIVRHETILERHFRALDELERRKLPPAETLRILLALHAAHCITFPGFLAFFMHEAVNPGPRLNIIVRRLVVPMHSHYLPFVKRAQEAGVVKIFDPGLAMTILITGISVPIIAPMLYEEHVRGTGLARKLVAEAARLLLYQPSEKQTGHHEPAE